jgi:hypothetical protein
LIDSPLKNIRIFAKIPKILSELKDSTCIDRKKRVGVGSKVLQLGVEFRKKPFLWAS